MLVYALSDLHLQAPVAGHLFTHEKEDVFVRVAEEAFGVGATLLLAGDVFDFTGMTPPLYGVAEFFAKVAPHVTVPAAPIDVESQMAALVAEFPRFFRALRQLNNAKCLWFVTGNHDYAIGEAGGRAALATALGVSSREVQIASSFRFADVFFALHGNEYDKSNSTNGRASSPGAIITAVLYHAMVPALRALGLDSTVTSAVPCVRPEEKYRCWARGISWGREGAKVLAAFVELLRVNGYFAGLENAEMWLATHVLSGLITPNKVRAALADDTRLAIHMRTQASLILAGHDPKVPGTPPSIVVMGHTHELDWTTSYVNLGTWIDHVEGLQPPQLARVDSSLPVLVTNGHAAVFYNCRALAANITTCPILWSHP